MDKTLFSTPILFLIFNRPDTTEKVFEKIREIRPTRLFVSADGPRTNKPGEAERCSQTRAIIKRVDWDCDIKTNFSDMNLGCRIGVSSGIDWFFSHVHEGIILEDDCLPDLSFFKFCETLLGYYRNDERIMHISGDNFQDGITRGNASYYISALNHVWGWATWKRAWNLYDVDMKYYPEILKNGRLAQLIPVSNIRNYWKRNFESVFTKQKDTWDIQWQFTMFLNNGLAIHPNVNLVSNIGFRKDASHTFDSFNPLADLKKGQLDVISHPESLKPDIDADLYTYKKYLLSTKTKKLIQLIRRILNKAIS
jgi:hypothetical protein